MIAMIRISVEEARIIVSENWKREVYELLNSGAESLVENESDIDDTSEYGIEGEVFGKPYGTE